MNLKYDSLIDQVANTIPVMKNLPAPPTNRRQLSLSERDLGCRQFVSVAIVSTGNNVHVDEPIEIAAVRFDLDGILDRFKKLIRPSLTVSRKVFLKHKIDPAILAGKPALQDVLPEFVDFLGGEESFVIQHSNQYVHSKSLGLAMFDYGLEHPPNVIVDTMKLTRRLVRNASRKPNRENGTTSFTLPALCREFEISDVQPVGAMPKAELTMNLFLKLCAADSSCRFLPRETQIQKVRDLFDGKMQPVFFTDLPVLAKFSVEHADILKAINERKELEIAVYDLPGQTCCGVVSPLWMTDCTGKTDLVFRFPDTITRRRIPVEQLVRWEII